MPTTFSSFGDVATVLHLAWQLRAALSNASGASAEIRALIVDVDSFTRALQQTRAAVEQRRSPLAPAVENGIKHAIIACHDALRLILGKVNAFKAHMTNRVGAAAWRQYWAIAAWSILGGKKDVDALRVRLSEQIGVVQTYLSLAHSNDQAKIQEVVESQGVALDRIYSVMQDIQTRFDVGVPTFHFYHEAIGYYTPFARTSFHRLKEQLDAMSVAGRTFLKLDEAVNRMNDASPHAILSPMVLSAWLSFEQRRMREWQLNWQGAPYFGIQLCIFKERAFDELQVLLGSPGSGRCPDLEVLKLSVERSHPVGSRCHCKIGPCRNRLEACRRLFDHWRPVRRAMLLINHIHHLAMYWDAEGTFDHDLACRNLSNTIYRIDRDVVQCSILPLLELHVECQHPSLSTIGKICQSEMRSVITCPQTRPIMSFSRLGDASLLPFKRPLPFVESLMPSHPLEWL